MPDVAAAEETAPEKKKEDEKQQEHPNPPQPPPAQQAPPKEEEQEQPAAAGGATAEDGSPGAAAAAADAKTASGDATDTKKKAEEGSAAPSSFSSSSSHKANVDGAGEKGKGGGNLPATSTAPADDEVNDNAAEEGPQGEEEAVEAEVVNEGEEEEAAEDPAARAIGKKEEEGEVEEGEIAEEEGQRQGQQEVEGRQQEASTASDDDQQEDDGKEDPPPPAEEETAEEEEEGDSNAMQVDEAEAAAAPAEAGDEPSPAEEEDHQRKVGQEEPQEGEEEEDDEEEEAGSGGKQQDASYSTRGRSGDSSGGNNDPLERLAREALGELFRERPPSASAALRESFLSDSITEEERRTRTRYIPAVDGMHALRKHEVKGDVALARVSLGGGGGGDAGGSGAASKGKPKRGNSVDMDVDDDDAGGGGGGGAGSMDDDLASDALLRAGATTKTIEMGAGDLVLPSAACLPPPPPAAAAAAKAAPNEVEATTAFNPPRPPESIGPKKRHRMLRWERRPADIEVDLNNYRKTVHRTREELKNARSELHRLECVDNHLRRHFFIHLQSLGEEWKVLSRELSAVQQECIDSAQLLTSRTRSRGAGKSSYAMRDVLTVLRTKGQEIEAKGLSLAAVPSLEADKPPSSGIGGVGAVSLEDWDRSTEINPAPIASSWILPGDAVQTPYGDGVVVAVYGEGKLDVNDPPHKDLGFGRKVQSEADDRMDVDEGQPSEGAKAPGAVKGGDAGKTGNKKGSKSKQRKDGDKKKGSGSSAPAPARPFLLAPRIAVRLPFGVGFFPVKSVVSKEDPSTYSDARLAQRWKGIVDTSAVMGSTLDIEPMVDYDAPASELTSMEIEEGGADLERAIGGGRPRLLPFGSGMFPTMNGRGDSLWKLSFEELDKAIDSTMFNNGGILGLRENVGVPPDFRKQEDDRQELLNLQAQAQQLKNQIYRQRRVRMLNERMYLGAEERAVRVEALVAEMRTDLMTLKRRLDEDVTELGISEDVAERLIASFYDSFDLQDEGGPSMPKRQRRLSRLETEDDDLDDGDDEQVDSALDVAAH